MVKKLKALAKSDDSQLAEAVRSSAHQIWQAGLGAFAKAQEEGGKVFAKLVKDGTDLQKRTQMLAENKVSGVTDTVTRMADNVSKQASGSWDKLEQVFEDRVSRSLTRLGVPTQRDIQALIRRVEELNKAVTTLSAKKPAAGKSAAKKTASKTDSASSAARKVTSKSAPTRKTAVRKPAARTATAAKSAATAAR